MSKFKVEFTLKQHTPIIHFQSEQMGATLRATELKPKLDRFLKEFVFNEEIPEEFLINGQENALDYKVKVLSKMSKTETIEQRDPLFFGNMGDGEKKKFVLNDKADIIISSFNLQLLNHIKENFEAFIAMTNFGTRQSKGYGSYYIDGKKFDPSLIPFKIYSFSSNSWKKDLKLFYSFLRQGINFPIIDKITKEKIDTRFYSKPAIFSYAKSKNWTWDKKAIKENYFNDKLTNQQAEHENSDVLHYDSDEKYLLRDLFGLSSSQEWLKPYYKTITKEHQEIERFKSPLTFKIVDDTVYFWANDSIDDILNKQFTIKAGDRNNLQLSTPQKFDFDDFFNFVAKINLSKHIDTKFHNTKEYKTLEKILKDLQP